MLLEEAQEVIRKCQIWYSLGGLLHFENKVLKGLIFEEVVPEFRAVHDVLYTSDAKPGYGIWVEIFMCF